MKGVQIHTWDIEKPYYDEAAYWSLIKALGCEWVRVEILSPTVQWLIDRMNSVITNAHANGMKILGILDRYIVNESPTFTLNDWETALINTKNVFPDIDAWEAWNEPNIPQFQLGYQDGSAQHIVDMLQKIYEVMNPTGKPIVFSAMSPQPGSDQLVQDCWNLGAASYCDIASYHIYLAEEEYGNYLQNIINTTSPKPLWITEAGVSSLTFGLEGQAEYLKDLDQFLKDYSVQKIFWYTFQDYALPEESTNYSDYMGLVTVDLNVKPAYSMYQKLATPTLPTVYPIVLGLGIGTGTVTLVATKKPVVSLLVGLGVAGLTYLVTSFSTYSYDKSFLDDIPFLYERRG